MKKDQYKMFSDHTTSDCSICFAGIENCGSGHSYGPSVRPTYIIHYIISGQGKYLCQDQEFSLHTGDAFLIFPDMMTFYQANFQAPWKYLWIGFHGNKIPEYLSRMGLDREYPIFHSDEHQKLIQIVEEILSTDSSSFAQELKRKSLFYAFLSLLSPQLDCSKKVVHASNDNNYLMRAIEFIQQNYFNQVKVSDVANYLGITRNYLFFLFKKDLGFSPQEYITHFKLTKACNLLSDFHLPIEHIAYSCGYDGLSVFSKAFKRQYHITPSQYRKAKSERPELSNIDFDRYVKSLAKKH